MDTIFLVLVCSANSMELAMLAKNNDDWTVGILDDAGRAELPLPKVDK